MGSRGKLQQPSCDANHESQKIIALINDFRAMTGSRLANYIGHKGARD